MLRRSPILVVKIFTTVGAVALTTGAKLSAICGCDCGMAVSLVAVWAMRLAAISRGAKNRVRMGLPWAGSVAGSHAMRACGAIEGWLHVGFTRRRDRKVVKTDRNSGGATYV